MSSPEYNVIVADRWDTAAGLCAEMARAVLAREGVQDVLAEILQWSVRIVDGCEVAGITTARRGGRVDTAAATDPLARESDRLQNELREGPCHDALWKEATFHSPDLSTEARWARYAPAAAAAGIRSVLAFRLYTGHDTLGALDLYSTKVDAFDEVDERVGLVVASHASVAFRWAMTEQQLREAIESRQVIGAAIGLVMERSRVSADRAFALLVRASQDTNVKLRELAEQVVASGQPPAFGCPG